MKRKLSEIKFEDLKDKNFDMIRVVEMLCEVCKKPLSTKERVIRKIRISTSSDFQNLLRRATAHDRVEVDIENGKIYLYDHDFPGDIHTECVEKL